MNPLELFNQVKDMIAEKDFSAAQDFIAENKDNLGNYFEQAQTLLDGAKGADGILGKITGLFGK